MSQVVSRRSVPLRAAAFAVAVLSIQSVFAQDDAAELQIPERIDVAAADPAVGRAYLDDSNGVGANDGLVEVVTERYTNGAPRVERCVTLDPEKNYVNHGAWKMYSPKGEVLAEGQYDMGRRIGLWSRFITRTDATLLGEHPYNKFKPPFTSHANFANGEIDGEWLIEDADKKKVVQISFENGERHGPSIAWLPNAKMYRQATYDEGVPVGDVLEVNKNGEFERTASYVDGRKVITKTSYYKGTRNKKSEALYLAATTTKKSPDDFWNIRFAEYTSQGKDLRHGQWKEWYASGKPSQEGFYQNDKKSGVFTYWHENGQIAVTGEYKDDVPQGLWVWYHDNGLKSTIGKYLNGSHVGEWRWWNIDGRLTKRTTYDSSESFTAEPQDAPHLGQAEPEADTLVR